MRVDLAPTLSLSNTYTYIISQESGKCNRFAKKIPLFSKFFIIL